MVPSGPRREPDLDDIDATSRTPGPEPMHWALLALDAVRRRKLVAAAVFLAVVSATFLFYRSTTPKYRVEARILVQRQQALPTAIRAAFEDVPTRSAWEIIHRRENLLAIVRATNLVKRRSPPEERGLLQRLLPHRGEQPKGDPLETWVTTLDKELLVTVQEGTIEIAIELSDPQLAYDIVQAAVQNFLEARHIQEVQAIDEVLSGLRARAAALRHDLDTAVQEARRRVGVAKAAPVVEVPRPRLPSPELVRLQSQLAAKQRALQDVEEFRRRRLSDLQAQLDQARTTLSEKHPTVIGLHKDIEALAIESPQIATLREEEQKLSLGYSALLAREGLSANAAPQPVAPLPAPVRERDEVESDPLVRQARILYEQIANRTNSTEAELDAARAAFKYRYNVVWPPQVPQDPVSPNPVKIFALGLAASLILALGISVAPDLLGGRIRQRWQVERLLGVTVLGELDRH